MHARLNIFKVKPQAHARFAEFAERYGPRFRALPGCREVLFLVDDRAGEWASVSLWDSDQEARDASAGLTAELERDLADLTVEPIRPRFFRVHEPEG